MAIDIHHHSKVFANSPKSTTELNISFSSDFDDMRSTLLRIEKKLARMNQ